MRCYYFIKKPDDERFISIEEFLFNSRVTEVSGLNIGSDPKNIYIETFAESNKSSVYISPNIVGESNDIEITIAFMGSTGLEEYKKFYDFIRNNEIVFWDYQRKLITRMVYKKAPKKEKEFFDELLLYKFYFETTDETTIKP